MLVIYPFPPRLVKKAVSIIGFCLFSLIFLGGVILALMPVSAEVFVPPVVREMVDDIRTEQAYVKEHEPRVHAAKEKVKTYRQAICRHYPEFCTPEYLNPLGEPVNLSLYLP